MKATQILMDEHRVIERVLTALEIAAGRLEQGEELRPAFFINAALFIKNFADGCHHHKEEGILFIAMNQAGMSSESGPLAVMLAEHVQGREFTAALKEAAEAWEKGNLRAKQAVAHNALGYVSLLRHHIQKEDKILFPMAEQSIPVEQHEQVDADFARAGVEEENTGVQEKYRALAEVLERESARKI
jgi:hemerythrin-like domain-containing protein